MKAAREDARDNRSAEPAHRPIPRRRPRWWLLLVLTPLAAVVVPCTRDAMAWIGRPFAGFLFLDNRIVVSIGRATWRDPGLRRVEWGLVTAVDGITVPDAATIHDAVARTGNGTLTYTLRRGAELFRVAVPVRRFDGWDFAIVFAPMLATGLWTITIGAAFLAARPDVPSLRAAFVVCVALGLALITSPDVYGPYRFVWVFYLALGVFPAAVFHLTAAFLWWPSPRTRRLTAAVYATCAAFGAALAARRFEPAVFLPLLYTVYFALANALVLYIGTLVSAFVSRRELRPMLALALAGVVAPALVPIAVLVTYPLWTEPVSVPWFIMPVGLWPLLHGLALVRLSDASADGAGVPA